jgi:hypothetical protein
LYSLSWTDTFGVESPPHPTNAKLTVIPAHSTPSRFVTDPRMRSPL